MRKTTLPNGIEIAEINPYETKFLYDEIFKNEEYTKNEVDIPNGAVIVDVGANIGLFALYMLTKFEPAHIFCFEPAPNCAEALRSNLSAWQDQVSISEMALADANGAAEFTYYPGYSIMSGLHADADRDLDVLKAGARTQLSHKMTTVDDRMVDIVVGNKMAGAISFPCTITTLSDVISRQNIETIDLLKVDVERAENAVIRGIRDEHWPRIRQIVVEVHDQGDREQEKMRDLLVGKGFRTELTMEDSLRNSAIYNLTARRV